MRIKKIALALIVFVETLYCFLFNHYEITAFKIINKIYLCCLINNFV